MNTGTPTDVQTLRAGCDQLVATAADPTTARSVLLRMWAMGAAAADDLLTDLHQLAVHHASRTGTEATLTELLHALGRHGQATAHAEAVAAFAGGHHSIYQTSAADQPSAGPHRDEPSVQRASAGAGAAARIHQTVQNRRRTSTRAA